MAKQKFDFIQPFKDIPQFFKNFPKSFKSVFKGPMTNAEEVKECKANAYALIYAGGFLTVLFAFLTFSLNGILSEIVGVLELVCLCLAVAAFFMLKRIKTAEVKFATLECENCKHRITYDDNVKYTLIDKNYSVTKSENVIKKNDIPSENSISVSGIETVTLEITCRCQECGTEKTFVHKFTTAECEMKGRYSYVASGAMLVEFEHAVRAEGAEGFEGKEIGTTANGVQIKNIRTPDSLVAGFFGSEIL